MAKVQGAARLRRLLQSLDPAVTQEVRQVIRDGAGQILREALSRVPRDHGTLASQIRFEIISNGFGAKVGIFGARAMKKAYYAKWVEYGTNPHSVARGAKASRGSRQNKGGMHPGTRARPFLIPAFLQRGPNIVKALEAALGRALDQASGVAAAEPLEGEE